MDDHKKQALRNRALRGTVLRTLALFYPIEVSIREIKTALLERGLVVTADTTKVLHYLNDKGYIRKKSGELRDNEDDDLVELTAKGVDLLEGTILDDGVDV